MINKRRGCVITASFLLPHARSHPEGGRYGGKYGDNYLDDFSPDAFVVFVIAHDGLFFDGLFFDG